MNRQDEPFDGICGYSNGGLVLQTLLKVLRYFKKDVRLKHGLPIFIMDEVTPRWQTFTYEFLRGVYISNDHFTPGLESLHFASEKDIFKTVGMFQNYENPVVIYHNQGHIPVRTLPLEKLMVMADFFVR